MKIKHLLLIAVTLFSLLACEREFKQYEAVEIPDGLRDLYYFGEGSYWVYASSDDSTTYDTIRLATRTDCGQIMINRENGNFQIAEPFQGFLFRRDEVSLTTSNLNFQGFNGMQFGFSLTGKDGHWVPVFGNSGTSLGLIYDSNSRQYLDASGEDPVIRESVSVPAGIFDSVLVSTENSIDIAPNEDWPEGWPPNAIKKVYLVPGLGVVRYDLEVVKEDSINGGYTVEEGSWDLVSWELQ